jgi:DNA-binding transcriptional LysR family regulator
MPMRIDYDLRRLLLLRELKHRGTMAAVASALSYSPSAISQQLAVLEQELGVRLLEREGRRVRLTPEAEVLIESTEEIVRVLEAADARMTALRDQVAGTVRISSFQTVALALLPRLVRELATRHPLLKVEVTQEEPDIAIPALLVGDFDVVITEQYPGPSASRSGELYERVLFEDPMRLAVPLTPEFGSVHDIADLADAPWAMEPRDMRARQWATSVCRAAGFEPQVVVETDDMLTHARFVTEGVAVALLPDLIWAETEPAVRLLPLPGDAVRGVALSVRRGWEASSQARAVLEALEAVMPAVLERVGARARSGMAL